MAETIRSVMTTDLATVRAEASVVEAARLMRQFDCGDVIVTGNGSVIGIATDRDLVVRCVADGKDPANIRVGDVCTKEPVTLRPAETIAAAVRLMSEKAIRRLPVVEDGKAVGIVSLGDLAQARDQKSALGKISAAPPNQ
jgi:CBS domain-containing protein